MREFIHESEYRGAAEIQKLASFKLVLAGAGAIGSNLAYNLARQGFQSLAVIDFDRVAAENTSTQCYSRKDIGAMKVAALGAMLFRDLGVSVTEIGKKLEPHNVVKFLGGHDLILDCLDNSAGRQTVHGFAQGGAACLHIGLEDGYGECIWEPGYKVPGDPPKQEGPCDLPLARNLILLTVAVASEATVDFALRGERKSWAVTLRDRKVSELK